MAQTAKETRNRIFSCAFELIKAKGFEKVTVNEICRASEISKTTFYYYFTSKEDILIEFYRSVDESTSAKLSHILGAESYLEQLWLLMETFLNFITISGPELTRQFVASGFVRNIGTEKSFSAGTDTFCSTVSLIDRAQRMGQIRNKSAAVPLAQATFQILLGTVTRWCADPSAYEVKSEVLRMFTVLYDVPDDERSKLEDKT